MTKTLSRVLLLGLLFPIATLPAIAAPPGALDLTPYRGKVVLVDFWASWCTPCAESFPWMEALLERHGPDGFAVVAVNLDENPDDAARFLAGRDAPFEHVSDPGGEIARAFGVEAMPTAILFDRAGQPAFVHSGFHSEERAAYEEHVVALLEGRSAGDPELVDRFADASTGAAGPRGKTGVDPWERGVLARDDMRLDCDPLDLAIDDHIYFSKEASSGGRGFGGGGCGCN